MRNNLPVASGNNRGVRALGVGKLEQTRSLVDCGCRRALGREVVEQTGGVRAAYTLDPHIRGTVVCLERIGEYRPGLFALRMLASYTKRWFSVCLRRAMTRIARPERKNTHHVSFLRGAPRIDQDSLGTGRGASSLEFCPGGGRVASEERECARHGDERCERDGELHLF